MIIVVTKKNIAFGHPGESAGCPIALALKRKGAKYVCVSSAWMSGILKGSKFSMPLPVKARRFVKDFDAGASVKPFKFIIA